MESEDISKDLDKILKKIKTYNIETESINSFTDSINTEISISESNILESEITQSDSSSSMTPINGPSKISTINPNTDIINKKYTDSSLKENKLPSVSTANKNTTITSSSNKSKIYKINII